MRSFYLFMDMNILKSNIIEENINRFPLMQLSMHHMWQLYCLSYNSAFDAYNNSIYICAYNQFISIKTPPFPKAAQPSK